MRITVLQAVFLTGLAGCGAGFPFTSARETCMMNGDVTNADIDTLISAVQRARDRGDSEESAINTLNQGCAQGCEALAGDSIAGLECLRGCINCASAIVREVYDDR
ncbi:MAG: hypothetical protein HOP29_02165 [Phycisphaerales bacterium]|nr:hypothetical protein [Phycisphaerales bacterium]